MAGVRIWSETVLMSGAALVFFFQIVSLVGSAAVVLKLFNTGLYQRYRIFFYYFIFRVANGIWPLVIGDVNSDLYYYLWVATTPVVWGFYILVVVELYQLVLARHKGLLTIGRYAMYLALLISVGLSILSLLPRLAPTMSPKMKTFGYVLAIERGVDSSLVIFILLILLFLSRYPVPLSRNVIVHAVIYSVYFLCGTMAVLYRTVFGITVNELANIFLMGIAAACVVAWLFLLSRKGEDVKASAPAIPEKHEARLLLQLDALNATMLKVSRK